MATITTTTIIIITHCPPPITHSPSLLTITATELVVVVMAAAKTTTTGPGASHPQALQYIFCFFNCYENITETVPQTWMAIATTTITSCLLPVACHPSLTNTKQAVVETTTMVQLHGHITTTTAHHPLSLLAHCPLPVTHIVSSGQNLIRVLARLPRIHDTLLLLCI
jgi:hypothetical protein